VFRFLEVFGNLRDELRAVFEGLVNDLLELEVASFVLGGLQCFGGFRGFGDGIVQAELGGWDGAGNMQRELSTPLG
jgi:hypothetical protein